MDKILVLMTPEEDGAPGRPALEALGAALDLGPAGSVAVGLWGAEVQKAADAIAGNAAAFYGVAGPDFAAPRYATDAAAAEAIVRAAGASLVVVPGTSRLARILGGVAHRVGGRADTHVTSLQAGPEGIVAGRWHYRQRLEARFTRSSRPWFLALEPGARAPAAPVPGRAKVELLTPALPEAARRTRVEGFHVPEGGGQTIRPDAGLLLVAGAGWTKKQPGGKVRTDEAGKLILEFLRKTRASLGSSKSLVDQKGEGQAVLPFLTHLNQVGQTGSTPRHPKGLATCCHGEEPHVVGWRFVPQRRAVNLDPNCGWAKGKADVVYVADAFEVLEKVNALLS